MALSERKMAIVQTLIESAPDKAVNGLQAALAQAAADSRLTVVRQIVENELRDRKLRNLVLQPVAPMCVGGGADARIMTFPAGVLKLVWRGLKSTASAEVATAAALMVVFEPGETSAAPFDALTRIAAERWRARDPDEFRVAAELCDQTRPEGAALFAACLDLAPVVREASQRLPAWIAHVGEDATAAARLAYRDAVTIADDAGPRFFEMLAAQLPQPWMILRIISAVMDKPNERYLADSEMVGFAERAMTQIDEGLAAVARLQADAGPEAGHEAGRGVELVTRQITELEACIGLGRGEDWGARVLGQKKALASVVEAKLAEAEKAIQGALPTQAAKLARIRTRIPKLAALPDGPAVHRALTLLSFVEHIRGSANYGGFASARTKLLDKQGDVIDHYVEEVLHHLKIGDVSEEIGQAYLAVAVSLMRLIRDEKAADLIRRRAAAAIHNEVSAAFN